jgi:hypothetical protein
MPGPEADRPQVWDAELFRIKGELLWKASRASPEELAQQSSGSGPSAEGCLLRALDIARAQAAKLLELRAAVSLCRYWREHGKKAEGRALLRETYSWFSEGLEAADLRAAQALLEELG